MLFWAYNLSQRNIRGGWDSSVSKYLFYARLIIKQGREETPRDLWVVSVSKIHEQDGSRGTLLPPLFFIWTESLFFQPRNLNLTEGRRRRRRQVHFWVEYFSTIFSVVQFLAWQTQLCLYIWKGDGRKGETTLYTCTRFNIQGCSGGNNSFRNGDGQEDINKLWETGEHFEFCLCHIEIQESLHFPCTPTTESLAAQQHSTHTHTYKYTLSAYSSILSVPIIYSHQHMLSFHSKPHTTHIQPWKSLSFSPFNLNVRVLQHHNNTTDHAKFVNTSEKVKSSFSWALSLSIAVMVLDPNAYTYVKGAWAYFSFSELSLIKLFIISKQSLIRAQLHCFLIKQLKPRPNIRIMCLYLYAVMTADMWRISLLNEMSVVSKK